MTTTPTRLALTFGTCLSIVGYALTYTYTTDTMTALVGAITTGLATLLLATGVTPIIRDCDAAEAHYRALLLADLNRNPDPNTGRR